MERHANPRGDCALPLDVWSLPSLKTRFITTMAAVRFWLLGLSLNYAKKKGNKRGPHFER